MNQLIFTPFQNRSVPSEQRFFPFNVIVVHCTTNVSSFGDDNTVPLIEFDISLKLSCPWWRNIFNTPEFPAIASNLIAPATFNAGNMEQFHHSRSVLYDPAESDSLIPVPEVCSRIAHEELYALILLPDISTLCHDVHVLIVPPFITRSVPSQLIQFVDGFPIENLYAAPEYQRKNPVPVLNAVCHHRMSPFVLSTIDPAQRRVVASLLAVMAFATI